MGCAASSSISPANAWLEDASGSLHPTLDLLLKGSPESVVVLAGAGISCSAGIPDFRSPGTGLYDNLQRFNLPQPKAVFDIDFFRGNPKPFTILAKELWPCNFKPTATHFFVKLLEERGLLLRHYTQNVDGLDRAAGISEDKIVEAHGSFGAGHCIDCKSSYCAEFIRESLFNDQVVRCEACGGLVKPDITFFGEPLPQKFMKNHKIDLPKAELVLCMGTSLQVQPFASLADRSRTKHAQRVLVNREKPYAWSVATSDLILLGDCDTQVWSLCEKLGWTEDLARLMESWTPRDKLADIKQDRASATSTEIASVDSKASFTLFSEEAQTESDLASPTKLVNDWPYEEKAV